MHSLFTAGSLPIVLFYSWSAETLRSQISCSWGVNRPKKRVDAGLYKCVWRDWPVSNQPNVNKFDQQAKHTYKSDFQNQACINNSIKPHWVQFVQKLRGGCSKIKFTNLIAHIASNISPTLNIFYPRNCKFSYLSKKVLHAIVVLLPIWGTRAIFVKLVKNSKIVIYDKFEKWKH